MARPNKIRTHGRESDVRKLAAKGLTTRQIADKLAEDGFKIGHVAVARFLKEETEDRRDAARHVASKDAKESVPLSTKALRQLVIMNLRSAEIAYRGEGDDDDPRPDVHALAKASNACTRAASTLHGITVGDEPAGEAMRALHDKIHDALERKRKRG